MEQIPTGCPNILAKSSGSTSSYTWRTAPYSFIPEKVGDSWKSLDKEMKLIGSIVYLQSTHKMR